jgi:hypothetical protein
MTTAALVVLIGIFVLGAAISKTMYYLWFMAGITLWGLGIWWVYNPLVSGASPINDIVTIITIAGGFGLAFIGIGQRTRTVNGEEVSGFNLRLPSFLGGMSEEEEQEMRNMNNLQYRNQRYQERLSNASRGIRRR